MRYHGADGLCDDAPGQSVTQRHRQQAGKCALKLTPLTVCLGRSGPLCRLRVDAVKPGRHVPQYGVYRCVYC